MKKKDKRRRLKVIQKICNEVKRQDSYSCMVSDIFDSSLRLITKSSPKVYDSTWRDDHILAIRFLRTKGYHIEVAEQWANAPSYFKGELFYNNTTLISITRYGRE